MTLPSLFLSHGAPTLPLTDTPVRTFLSRLGSTLPRPKAILVISAHWETLRPTVNAVNVNDTIHQAGADAPAEPKPKAKGKKGKKDKKSGEASPMTWV